ncbi:MAG: hypothetical protein IJR14_09435 [Synergistaceae bacterium]|nr:hypothetical protein [Synergistaceae bacterium]
MFALALAWACLIACPREVLASPFDETIQILERWTSAHWGRDCFVWVVHYPEELIGPWVEAEALRSGMSDAERDAYRERFVEELKIDAAETFLVSVYSFGASPVSLSPASDNIALVTSSGARVRPTRYDSGLDSPSPGIVQGLVFFPKQADDDIAVSIKGMGHGERIFSFDGRGHAPSAREPQPEPELVVVDLPKRSVTKAPVKVVPSGRRVEPAPETPPPPPAPKPIPPLLEEDSSDMAEFVESMRAPKTSKDQALPEPAPKESAPRQNFEDAYVSREHVLRQFLGLWADGRSSEMYDMLSDASRRTISRENFVREVAKASELRAGLRDGYRIDWIGEERAKVIADRRLLMFRTLVSRTLGVVREGSSWKIVW